MTPMNTALALASLALVGAGTEPAPGKIVIKAATIITEPGKSIPRGVIVVEDGKISAIGTDLGIPTGARVFDYGAATLAPGFVDAHAVTGAAIEITDTTHAFTAGVRALDAFRPDGLEMRKTAAAGVTTIALAPPGQNVLCGLAACVTPTRQAPVLAPTAFLKISLSPRVFEDDRYPASVAGALKELEKRWKLVGTDPKAAAEKVSEFNRTLQDPLNWFAPKLGPADARALAMARKEIRPWFEISDETTARQVLKLAAELSLKPVFIASGDLTEVASEIAGAKVPVILPSLDLGSGPRALKMPQSLQRAGVEFAFATVGPERGPETLRAGAALAVASGLDRTVAFAAVTTRAAKWLGIESQVSTLEVGKLANFVAYSGDPLDLSASMIAVHICGEPVAAPAPGARKETP